MSKPIAYWINQLPDGYRERAIRAHKNAQYWRRTRLVNGMSYALSSMAEWDRTYEGYMFWDAVQCHYLHRELPLDYSYTELPALPTTGKPRLRK